MANSRARPGMNPASVFVGVPPDGGKCSGQVVLELKREESLPDKPWKVHGMAIKKFD
jgi:hypothetical protein